MCVCLFTRCSSRAVTLGCTLSGAEPNPGWRMLIFGTGAFSQRHFPRRFSWDWLNWLLLSVITFGAEESRPHSSPLFYLCWLMGQMQKLPQPNPLLKRFSIIQQFHLRRSVVGFSCRSFVIQQTLELSGRRKWAGKTRKHYWLGYYPPMGEANINRK